MKKSMNAWARAVHIHCLATKTGVTAIEAVAIFGEPGSTATGGKLLQRAAAKGRFRSVRERIPAPRDRGQWFVARYFAVGETPDEVAVRPAQQRPQDKGYFGTSLFANSIFDLATKVNQ